MLQKMVDVSRDLPLSAASKADSSWSRYWGSMLCRGLCQQGREAGHCTVGSESRLHSIIGANIERIVRMRTIRIKRGHQ
jgi:hypothetical protein